MRLTFYGACREVTGSNILLDVGGKKILLDCGFFQGYKLAEERNYEPFVYNPSEIDFVMVGHAHLDHVGRLPVLYKRGFRGTIYATAPTKDIAELVLLDSEKLMREEAERDNHKPLFDFDDITGVMNLFEALEYKETLEISPNIKLTFYNAGHILGSALTKIEAEGKTLVYTSDLGNTPSELLDPPAVLENADVVICESTYGSRVHEDFNKRAQKLSEIITSTVAQNGVLMIPSFAIERTQELLHDIDHFCEVGNCEKPIFFLDSPLAEKVTKVFEKYPEYLNAKITKSHKAGDIFGEDRVKITASVEESKAIDLAPAPKIIMAGSGMMNGGRILFHLQKYISDPTSTVLIVGYQAQGTLGRRLFDGEHEVKIFGKKYKVRAKVMAIGSYSAHADRPQLLSWLGNIKGVKKIFLVHGEAESALALGKEIKSQLNVENVIPQQGEEYEI